MASHRMLLVHAHPDDESIGTGATMAYYAARGVAVTLVTCTLGEEGEILVPELAQLEAAAADQLGGYRIAELAAAMTVLGVTDHRFLGAAGRYRDSGMIDTPANEHPRAFWRAATEPTVFAAAVAELVQVIDEVRPQVVITYDPHGGYGHPDHIMAHRVTTAAVAAASWRVAKIYWTITPASVLAQGYAEVAAAVATRPDLGFGVGAESDEADGRAVPDDEVTTVLDASELVAAKTAALEAHRTQVVVRESFYSVSNLLGRPISGIEHFRLAQGELAAKPDGLEHDLFAGITGD